MSLNTSSVLKSWARTITNPDGTTVWDEEGSRAPCPNPTPRRDRERETAFQELQNVSTVAVKM